jgi:hypothetical protein
MPLAAQMCRSLCIVLALPIAAHAHADKVTRQDYSGFERNDGGGSCCDWHDCRPASSPFMEPDGEKIMDRGLNKFLFDPGKVVKRPSDDGNWHVCGTGTRLKCIIAPPEAKREPGLFDSLFSRLASVPSANWSYRPAAEEIARELATAPICRAPGL